MEIGIIGFGRFGKLLTKYLSEDFKVYIFNRSDKNEEIKKTNGIPASLEEVCKKDVVIPCVPISQFEETLNEIKGLLKENSLIIDVCSVKEYPVEVMKKILPEKTQILATHPMFGPDSAAESLKDRKVVLCKVRIDDDKHEEIKEYLDKKDLIVIETTPEEHDKEIAKSLLLTHFIGRGLIDFGAADLDIDTEGHRRLISILDTVKNDTGQLFEDMNRYNKNSKKVREDFIKSLNKINGELEK
ncbi:MAG: prephenate dehydrogenase/arogenate dehydrogenase family protein [Candidatus Woesearchaeota archaeon]|jgi:prephenate dehydrogenase|nr:prephenate dehydrogenase/arogenate dehydrogenase family protein [Candidatus Woesearchaeota archaeon]|tara:strand:- start:985 stop:1713 length:729 start_codon:yes stop_codon:yes gene_type:complete